MFNHALDILNSERYRLKDMIRTCQRNGIIGMCDIPYDEYEKQLGEIEFAIRCLEDFIIEETT